MARKGSSKLNQMMLKMPHGAIVTSEWLHDHGVSSKLTWWYVKSNWLEKISDKAYKKPEEDISWAGVVSALQTQLQKPIHVSGKSALALTGKAHYIPMQSHVKIELATEERVALPVWLYTERLSKDKIKVHQNKLLISNGYKEFLIQKEFNGLDITLSCAELAILEINSLF